MSELSRSSPSPPRNLPPLPPPSRSSLPTDLGILFLNNIPRHPSKDRFDSLAQICLVNKFFLSIARPLLYHEVHLDFTNKRDKPWPEVFQTLLGARHCSILVKAIRISCDDELAAYEVMAIACLFTQLESLESVRTYSYTDGQNDLTIAIRKHQPGLKHLELRGMRAFGCSHHWAMLRTLGRLETLVGHFDSLKNVRPTSHQVNLACELHRFVSNSIIAISTFEGILHSSSTSLTSLAFWISPEHADFDLRRFQNLKTLRISMEDDRNGTLGRFHRSSEQGINNFASQIRRILSSTLSLPLETLSITAEEAHIPEAMAPYPVLTSLPSSLCHFSTIFEFLRSNAVNYGEILTARRRGRLPHLTKITVVPSGEDPQIAVSPPTRSTARRFRVIERNLRVSVDWHLTSPGLATNWFTLEPYLEETDDEA